MGKRTARVDRTQRGRERGATVTPGTVPICLAGRPGWAAADPRVHRLAARDAPGGRLCTSLWVHRFCTVFARSRYHRRGRKPVPLAGLGRWRGTGPGRPESRLRQGLCGRPVPRFAACPVPCGPSSRTVRGDRLFSGDQARRPPRPAGGGAQARVSPVPQAAQALLDRSRDAVAAVDVRCLPRCSDPRADPVHRSGHACPAPGAVSLPDRVQHPRSRHPPGRRAVCPRSHRIGRQRAGHAAQQRARHHRGRRVGDGR